MCPPGQPLCPPVPSPASLGYWTSQMRTGKEWACQAWGQRFPVRGAWPPGLGTHPPSCSPGLASTTFPGSPPSLLSTCCSCSLASQDGLHSPSVQSHGSKGTPWEYSYHPHSPACPRCLWGPQHLCVAQRAWGSGCTVRRAGRAQLLAATKNKSSLSCSLYFSLIDRHTGSFVILIEVVSTQNGNLGTPREC